VLESNLLALVLTFSAALLWLRLNDYAAGKGWIDAHLSRKLIHIGTGPVFVLCWLLFPEGPLARYLAALVPLAITAQFALVGLSIIRDEDAVRAMSRSGDPREILRGPLYYGLVFVVLTVVFWKASPAGILALMLLCGGDGLADVVGRRWGRRPLPWSRGKTWAGTLAMVAGGWVFGALVLAVYLQVGIFPGTIRGYLPPLTAIAFTGALVESLPLTDVDNLTVPAAAVLVGLLVF
jgi:phytol kinase